MNNLLQELRDATSGPHRRLDHLISASPAASRASYGGYLLGFHRGLAASWPMLDWAKLAGLGLPDRQLRERRYRRLAMDLETLGFSCPPLRNRSPGNAAFSVGCLYVLEGSIHGGGVILSAIRKNGTDIPDDATGFLHGFGEDNARMWRSFVTWLQSLETPSGFIAEARHAAGVTFSGFLTAFDPNSWNPANPT